MAYKVDEILSDDLITVVERNDERGFYALRFGDLDTVVFIELGRFQTSETTGYKISHAIHTPVQAGPYRTSIARADYWAAALHKAVTGITSYYRDAVKAGYEPQESWLVE